MNNSGIKDLMDAETQARGYISAARKQRGEKLKQARDEAAKEVAEFRQQEEAKYATEQNNVASGGGDITRRLNQETDATIDRVKREFAGQKNELVSMLLGYVTNVHCD
eukprot:GFYU01000239.1.p2 GENE.GFYU01000239.1~~GFYU01000239.1.p2  ORF type:complete len:123 (+),score=39.30 GFYU01000239.1:46-369(+)